MILTSFVCLSILAQRLSSVTSPTAALDIPDLPLHPTLTIVSCPLTHCPGSSHTLTVNCTLAAVPFTPLQWGTACSYAAALQFCSQWCHLHNAMGLWMLACSLLLVPCLHTADPWQYQIVLFFLGFVHLFLSSELVGFLIWMMGVQGFFGPLGFCKHFILVFSLWKFWSVKVSCLKTITSLYNLFCIFPTVSGLQILSQLIRFLSSPSLPCPWRASENLLWGISIEKKYLLSV